MQIFGDEIVNVVCVYNFPFRGFTVFPDFSFEQEDWKGRVDWLFGGLYLNCSV